MMCGVCMFDGRRQEELIDLKDGQIDALRADNDALRADAERYRWLRERLSHQRCGPHVGWGTDTLLPGDDPDTAIDAARKEGDG